MTKAVQFIVLIQIILIVVCAGCATGGFEDKQEFSDAYITTRGFIGVAFWRQPDGLIRVRAWGDKDDPDEFLVEQWRKFAQKLTRNGSFEGVPKVETFHYTQGYSMVQPYAMGEDRIGKRAEGVIRIVPQNAETK